MIFNPDLTKQAQGVIFSRKTKKLLHPSLSFNSIPLKNSIFQKKFELTLDVKLNIVEHIKISLKKLVKLWAYDVDFKQSYQNHPYRLYKPFTRSQLDYGDVIYRQAYNSYFHEKLESLQYNACLAITGTIKGTASDKLYQELG